MDGVVQALRSVVGDAHVITDPTVAGSFTTDWTGRFRATARAVVRPASTEEVAAVVQVCGRHGVALTPQGGNTGLAGGAVPTEGGVVLSTRRLQRVDPVDTVGGTVVVGAGVTLARLQQHVAASGMEFGVDIASRESCTIGGMVATDAGGARVLLHGSMRAQVAGLRAVLPDGSTISRWLEQELKDTAGYDLRHLLVGSEGTLGVVTAVRLRLVHPVSRGSTVLLGLRSGAAVAAAVAELRRRTADHGARLTACEFLDDTGPTLSTRLALLVETDRSDDELTEQLVAVASTAQDVVLALDEGDRRRLWELREGQAEAVSRVGVPVKMDVAVPMAAFGRLLDELPGRIDAAVPGTRTFLYGHAAEANVHVNVVPPSSTAGTTPDELEARRVEEVVVDLVASLGGTISAEHGVGREKVAYLDRTRSSEEIDAMRAVKRALDPAGMMNPGVLLPAEATRPT